jgi:tricorn protease
MIPSNAPIQLVNKLQRANFVSHVTHKKISILLILLLCLVVEVVVAAPLVKLGYYRQPAIHNDTLVFVAEGDLWRTTLNNARAERLTTNLAEESTPAISPDGKLIAFTARYEGPAEVYVMPITGGLPTRLTYDGDNARVQGFNAAGKVLYSTTRFSDKPEQRMFAIDPVTRISTPLPLAEAAEGCYMGEDFIFARHPQMSDNVKNYRGGTVQRIWAFDGKQEAQLLTREYVGTSRQPMCGRERIFYLSDKDGTMNIWSMNKSGANATQHTQHRDFDIRFASISSDGARIAYQRGADINVYDVATGKSDVLSISLQSDFEQMRARWIKTPWDFVTDVSPSPTGDRVVITARGELVVFPVGNGRRVELVKDTTIRARDGIFSHDGKSVYAFTDETGEFELTRYPANGVGATTTLTKNATVLRRGISVSPDGKWVVHDDKTRQLYLTDLATSITRVIDRNEFGEYGDITFSPDSRYITFSKPAQNQFLQLYVIEIATTKLTTLTTDRYDARDAVFSQDGKWLYFMANRQLQTVVTEPWGQRRPSPFFDKQTKLYAYALDAAARWPFLPRDELAPPQSAKPPTDADKFATPNATKAASVPPLMPPPTPPPAPVAPIAFNDVRDRLYEVPMPAGNYRDLSTDGKRLYFLSQETSDRKNTLRSIAIEAPNPLPPTVDTFIEDIRSYKMTEDRKKLMVRRLNDIFVFDVGKAAPPALEFAKFQVNTRDWMIQIDPVQEWKQLFVDAWRMHRDYFYDKNMHGANWATARTRYQPLLARATDRAEVSDVIAQMTSEVRALHSQVSAPDVRRSQDTIEIGGLGAQFTKTVDGFRVVNLFGGDTELIEERSPLARAEVNINVGDTITSVNGVNAVDKISMGELLRNEVEKQVLLQVTTQGGKKRQVVVAPVTPRRERELRYLSWEKSRALEVDKVGQGRIGYVHLQAMGANDIARWTREFYPVFQRDGLIIDLRHNNGGNIDSWIIEQLQRRAWHFWQSRRTDQITANQQVTFRGHVVALIDANTYSDGETLAQGLRRLGIATLVGKTTAGAGIWLTDENRLRDNGIARAAELGSFVDDGVKSDWITEGVGVKPDIEVDNLPMSSFNGQDAQLMRALQLLNEKIARSPIVKPTIPAFPNLSQQ